MAGVERFPVKLPEKVEPSVVPVTVVRRPADIIFSGYVEKPGADSSVFRCLFPSEGRVSSLDIHIEGVEPKATCEVWIYSVDLSNFRIASPIGPGTHSESASWPIKKGDRMLVLVKGASARGIWTSVTFIPGGV